MNQIRLRDLRREDAELIVKWRNNEAIKKWLYDQRYLDIKKHLEYYEKNILSQKCIQFIIEEINDDGERMPIGTTFIKNIDMENKKGEFGIFIGEEIKQGKGVGSIVTKEMVDFAFENLKLHKLNLSVFKDNKKAIHVYQKVGFKIEGILKDDFLRNGKYLDVILMGIINA